MKIEEQTIVTISYEVRDQDAGGELLERMDVYWPFKFLFGTGKLLPAFEANLRGLAADDTFTFILSPDEAYGPVEQGNILALDRTIFKVDGHELPNMMIEGNYVDVVDDLGEAHKGKILNLNQEKVTVDFNHAMAGKTLHFKGVVLDVRKATIDELVRNHYIQEDGIHRPDFGETDEIF